MKQRTVLFLGVYLLFVASQPAVGSPIGNINWDPQVNDFILDITFPGPIDQNDTHTIDLTGPWRVNITILETAATALGFGQDFVTIIGSAQHLVAPHTGDAPNGFPWPIDFTFLAPLTVPPNGLFTPSTGVVIVPHPAIGHFDEFSIDIVANVSGGFGQRHIDSWQLIMRGVHVPEPATLVLLGSGLAGLAWRRHRRK